MSSSFNRVILIGNVTRAVELKHLQSGTAVTEVGLAINEKRKNQQGEWVDEPVFVDVVLWGRTAEIASQYLAKGDPVFFEARLKYDTWEADGKKRSKLKVVGERMQLLGGKKEGGGSQSGRKNQPSTQPTAYGDSHEYAASMDEGGDIPF